MTAWAGINLFPEGIIALNQELSTGYHPQLEELLSPHPVNEWEIRFAHIAAYCEVILDGDYVADDFNRLGFILTERLILKRVYPPAQIIISL